MFFKFVCCVEPGFDKVFFFQNTFVSLGHCLISSGLRVILLKLLSMPSLRRVWRGYSLDSLYRRGKTIVEWCSCQSFSGHLWMYLDKVLFSLFFKIRFYCCTFFLQINVQMIQLILCSASLGMPLDCIMYMNWEIKNVFGINTLPQMLRFLHDHCLIIFMVFPIFAVQFSSMKCALVLFLNIIHIIFVIEVHLRM